ncbi:SGNH/GDSL hydrolase family protein [Nocardia sp. SYP-A9097]|uniref:SGNH/GDSL hydrolase family protein n=1 Tax=Nocardia sp. SYP-A9097 TaxID=2663237 RepID=UPI00129AC6C3|nr:SGNH/GDSL hydrolase family protein [Nocardia sp. SYP-A9097]MRH88153.1 SGNH/GDSL hydrolase family protein [Nocardia sp. SYP-A9097]
MSGNSGRWLFAAVVAVAAVMTKAAGVSAEAAPEGKRLVVLGDSFTANGFDPLSKEQKCLRGLTAWPAQLSKLMGLQGSDQVADQSCVGASIDSGAGYTLGIEARDADKAGAFGPRTELVTLQFGLNDYWGGSDQSLWNAVQQCVFDLAAGCGSDAVDQGRMPDPRTVSGAAYAGRIRNVVAYIRYYAPNARIVLVGYPELFGADQDAVCLDFFGLVPFTQPQGRTVVEYFNRIDQAEREAAAQLKLDFLDARALTAGHGQCSPQPWVNGAFDPIINFGGLPFHPSPEGDAVVANALHEQYAR